MLNSVISFIISEIKNISILAPIFAFLGGVLTSISPCSLASIPLVVGFMAGTNESNTKKALKVSIVFSFGMAITYTFLGVLAALLSKIFNQAGKAWYIFLAIVLILMALQTFEVINVIPSKILTNKSGKKGYLPALLLGIMAGLFSSPCSTPILVTLLAIVARKGSLIFGTILLLLYSVGNSILIVATGTSAGFAFNVMSNKSYGKISTIVRAFFGIIILLMGLYFLYIAI